MRSKAYCLLCSYLSNRSLFVVANGNSSACREFTAGVPQGGVWSPILFNLSRIFVYLVIRFYIVTYFNMLG